MDTNDNERDRDGDRRESTGGGAVLQLTGVLRVWPEWWDTEWERFDGCWILDECTDDSDDDEPFALSLARMLVVRLAADAVRRDRRAEDLAEDIRGTNEYLDELCLAPRHSSAAKRVLAALVPFDAEAVSHALLSLAWDALGVGLDASARSLAQLAYDAAALHRCWGSAQGGAMALARIAKLQECTHTARRWQAIARLHSREEKQRRRRTVTSVQ